MATKPETRFRQNTVRPFLLKLKNTYALSIQQQALRGSPDILLCINGNFVALELKARGGKLTKLQEHHLGLIEKAGGLSLVARPDNWGEVKATLLKLDQGEKDA